MPEPASGKKKQVCFLLVPRKLDFLEGKMNDFHQRFSVFQATEDENNPVAAEA